jgi:hypothetical protein
MTRLEIGVSMRQLPNQLVPLLHKAAEEMFAAGEAPYLGDYDTCAGLGRFISLSAAELEIGNYNNLQRLWTAFAPTCDWDDARGSSAVANEIFQLLSNLRGRVGT